MEDPGKNSSVRQQPCHHKYKKNFNISWSLIFFNNDACFQTHLQHNYSEKNYERHYATSPEMRMTSVIRPIAMWRWQRRRMFICKRQMFYFVYFHSGTLRWAFRWISGIFQNNNSNANNVAERLRKMSIRFSVVIHTYNVLSHSWD